VDLGVWIDPADRAGVLEALGRGGSVEGLEMNLRKRSGEAFVGELFAEPIVLEGRPCHFVIVRDVTQRRRAFQEIARLKDALERERDYLREEVNVSQHFGEIVGNSPRLQEVLGRIEAVADTDANALIHGESGVGKELVARAIHARSRRSAGPLVKVNCATVPGELFESEFFGHVKGAYTGASRDRTGRFQLADGGTIFLDEVSEIPLDLQAKLLRVIQEKEFERVGEDTTRRVDVRVIAATNRNLEVEMEKGRFREDLYYRLSVFPIEVPPLRERRKDILPLASHFIQVVCGEFDRRPFALTRAQAEALEQYDWPGNVRELRNVLEQAVILSRGERLRLDLVLPGARVASRDDPPPGTDESPAPGFLTAVEFKRFQRENLVAALERAGWKVSGKEGAAELLGMKPTSLTYQMKALGIKRPG